MCILCSARERIMKQMGSVAKQMAHRESLLLTGLLSKSVATIEDIDQVITNIISEMLAQQKRSVPAMSDMNPDDRSEVIKCLLNQVVVSN